MRKSRPRVPTERLVADFEAGMSTAQIAKKRGMSKEGVRYRLNTWTPGCVARRFRQRQYEHLLAKYAASREREQARLKRNREIIAEARRGVPFAVIARKHGIHKDTARVAAISMGHPKVRACTRERDRKWLEMHDSGMTITEIAARSEKPWSTVREGIVRARNGYVFREREYDR